MITFCTLDDMDSCENIDDLCFIVSNQRNTQKKKKPEFIHAPHIILPISTPGVMYLYKNQ